jgi:hypothetical protein
MNNDAHDEKEEDNYDSHRKYRIVCFLNLERFSLENPELSKGSDQWIELFL